MIDVVMPQLGESVAEGTVTRWLVRDGDHVTRDQVLLEVATDKADTEVLAPAAGRVTGIAAAVGAVVPKQGLLCRIDDHDAGTAPRRRAHRRRAAPARRPPRRTAEPRGRAALVALDPQARARDGRRPPARDALGRARPSDPRRRGPRRRPGAGPRTSPPPPGARRSRAPPSPRPPPAASPALELSQLIQAGGGFVPPIPGVGFGAYKVPTYTPRPGDEVVPFNRRRRITADHMVYSKVTSPHVVTVAEVDLHATSKLRDEHKDKFKKAGVSLTFLAFICAATIKALREHPEMNARVLDGAYVLLRDVNLGIAVDTPGGLIVPSIKHADQLSLRGVAANIDELASRARAGKTTADDLANTTFTVSNPGQKGNLFGAAIISQPNVAILRMGEIKKRAVVVTRDGEDSIAIHPVMFMALSYDHRVIDGVLANSFLWRVADVLTRAEFEVT